MDHGIVLEDQRQIYALCHHAFIQAQVRQRTADLGRCQFTPDTGNGHRRTVELDHFSFLKRLPVHGGNQFKGQADGLQM